MYSVGAFGCVTGAGDRKVWFRSPALWLLQPDHTDDDGDVVDAADGQLEGFVVFVVGDDEDVVSIASFLDALDEGTLVGIEHIYFVPLEEEVCHGYMLAGHYISRVIFGIHAGSFYLYEKFGPLEEWHDITLALVFHDGLLAHHRTGHGVDWDEWNAFLGVVGMDGHRTVIFLFGAILVAHQRHGVGFQHGSSTCEEPIS